MKTNWRLTDAEIYVIYEALSAVRNEYKNWKLTHIQEKAFTDNIDKLIERMDKTSVKFLEKELNKD